jgi:hypothetical protein
MNYKDVQIKSISLITWTFVLCALLVYLFAENVPLNLNKKIALLSQLLFLNVIHVSFTFGFLFGSKNGKQLVNVAWESDRRRLFSSMFIVLVSLTICLSLFIYEAYLTKTLSMTYVIVFQILLVVILPAHHRFKQTQGLMLSNVQVLGSARDKRFISYFRIIFPWVAIIGLGINFLVRSELISTGFDYMKIILAFVLLILTLKMIFIESKANKTYSPVSLRFVLWPMAFFSDVALFGIIAIHGIEYFFVYLNLSIRDYSAHLISLVLAVFLVLAFFVRPLGGGGYENLLPYATVAVLSGFSYSLSLIHFFLDRKIFKMSDPLTRSIIGKVI